MSSFLNDLEAQLVAAARSRTARGAGGPSPRRRRLSGAAVRRNLPVLAAAVVTLAVVAAAFALLGHGRGSSPNAPASSPSMRISKIGARRLREEGGYIRAASRRVHASAVCRTSLPTRTTIIGGSPGRALLSTVAVLRRPASSSDRLSAQALQTVSEPVYGNAVRLARVVGHAAYYLVPTREDLSAWEPSARCFLLQEAALHRYAPRIPATLRSQTLALFAQLLAFDRSMIVNAPSDTLCLVSVGGNNSGTECGLTAAEIRLSGKSAPALESRRLRASSVCLPRTRPTPASPGECGRGGPSSRFSATPAARACPPVRVPLRGYCRRQASRRVS
jgi:hypothetical protein